MGERTLEGAEKRIDILEERCARFRDIIIEAGYNEEDISEWVNEAAITPNDGRYLLGFSEIDNVEKPNIKITHGAWHSCEYKNGELFHDGSWVDGKWYEWKDIHGNIEEARMKLDTPDHFYPPTDIIREEDVVAYREIKEEADSFEMIIPVKKKPEYCFECPCYRYVYGRHHCLALGKGFTKSECNPYFYIPDWCPAKDMPKKKSLIGRYDQKYFRNGGELPSVKVGWNKFIDYVLGRDGDENEDS